MIAILIKLRKIINLLILNDLDWKKFIMHIKYNELFL